MSRPIRRPQTIAEREEQGLCTRCGTRPPITGRVQCTYCRDYSRQTHLKFRDGLTQDQLEILDALRGQGCMICGRHETTLAIDHDHQTGKVRGLLCNPCNARLGWYEASKGAINDYLNDPMSNL